MSTPELPESSPPPDSHPVISIIRYELAARLAAGATWAEIAADSGLVNEAGEPDFSAARRITLGQREPTIAVAARILDALGYEILVKPKAKGR